MVFLLHFDKSHAHMGHYVGHAAGSGGGVPEKPFEGGAAWLNGYAGVEWRVARVWPDGDAGLQRKIRAEAHLAQLCPACSGEKAFKRGVSRRRGGAPARRPSTELGHVSPYLRVGEQTALCLLCHLRECVGVESHRCPIKIELRRRDRAYRAAVKNRKALES